MREAENVCLAVPLMITEINGKDAVAERDGIKRDIRLDFIKDPSVGDYVIVHAGFAIEKLRREQAEEDLMAIKEVEDAVRTLQ